MIGLANLLKDKRPKMISHECRRRTKEQRRAEQGRAAQTPMVQTNGGHRVLGQVVRPASGGSKVFSKVISQLVISKLKHKAKA